MEKKRIVFVSSVLLATFFCAFVGAEPPLKDMVDYAIKDAPKKAAVAAAKEAKEIAQEAHTFGGKFLQGAINVMIAASPGKTRVWLPAPSTDPNSGLTIGVLPVFLFVDKQERVRHIWAPSVTHNQIFGLTSTLRYYFYPRIGSQLFAFASWATKANNRLALRYENSTCGSDQFYFKTDLNILEEGSFKFYGFGPGGLGQDYNYDLKDKHLQFLTGFNFAPMRLTLTHRLRQVNINQGPIKSLPQIQSYGALKGVDDSRTIVAQRLTWEYDTRDLALAPQKGHYVAAFGEKAGHLGGEENFVRYGSEARGYYGLSDAYYVTAWRFLAEEEAGANTPFYEQSLLGGKDSLRGYGDWRFVDKSKLSLSIEERILCYRLKAFNVNVDFEVAPFYEGGTVNRDLGHLQLNSWHNVFGVGFRSIVRPSVVGVVEMGFSDEGLALFVGIDYPF